MSDTRSLKLLLRKDSIRWSVISSLIALLVLIPTSVLYMKKMSERSMEVQAVAVARAVRPAILSGNEKAAEKMASEILEINSPDQIKVLDIDFRSIYAAEAPSSICPRGQNSCWLNYYQSLIVMVPIFFDEQSRNLQGYLYVKSSPSIDFQLLGSMVVGIAIMQIMFILLYSLGVRRVGLNVSLQIDQLITDLKNSNLGSGEGEERYQEFDLVRSSVAELNTKMKQLSSQALSEDLVKKVAHDIRSPLAVIRMAVRSRGDLPEDLRQVLDRASDRMSAIATDLLKKKSLSSDSVDLAEHLKALIGDKAIEFGPLKPNFVLQNCDLAFPIREANLNGLLRVVSNLINNAVEAQLRNPQVEVKVEVQSDLRWNRISITDRGCGLSQTQLQNLFQKGSSTKGSGNGIGLWSAREFMCSIGGDLSLESDTLLGTVATLSFPRLNPANKDTE